MVGGVPELEESVEMVGGDFESFIKTGEMVRVRGMIYKAVTQSVPLYVSERWLVAGAMLRVLGGGSLSGNQTDHGDYSKTCGGQGLGISSGGGGTRISGITTHTGVHSENSGDHRVTGGMPPHL